MRFEFLCQGLPVLKTNEPIVFYFYKKSKTKKELMLMGIGIYHKKKSWYKHFHESKLREAGQCHYPHL
jgi:hypothetical protein